MKLEDAFKSVVGIPDIPKSLRGNPRLPTWCKLAVCCIKAFPLATWRRPCCPGVSLYEKKDEPVPQSNERPVNGSPRTDLLEGVVNGSSVAIPTRGEASCCGPVGRNVQFGIEEW